MEAFFFLASAWPPGAYSLEIAESFQVHDKVGPDFPHFLSDEQTLIYERAWGPDQLLCHQLGGKPIVPLENWFGGLDGNK